MTRLLVEVGSEHMLLAKLGGQCYAVSEVCTQAEGPLPEGLLEDEEDILLGPPA